MARAILTSTMKQRPQYEPLYDIDPRTGASIEVFYADRVLAKSFGTQPWLVLVELPARLSAG